MSKPIIITFSAKARNGKDSSAVILSKKLESMGKKVLKMGYADYLKYLVANYFGGSDERTPENRTLWQQFGTEKVRHADPNFWVDTVIRVVDIFGSDFDYILITDCRFPNEIYRWAEKDYDVISVHIERLNFENDLSPEQRNHVSETSLDGWAFDYYIKSENGLDKLELQIDKFIKYLEV